MNTKATFRQPDTSGVLGIEGSSAVKRKSLQRQHLKAIERCSEDLIASYCGVCACMRACGKGAGPCYAEGFVSELAMHGASVNIYHF